MATDRGLTILPEPTGSTVGQVLAALVAVSHGPRFFDLPLTAAQELSYRIELFESSLFVRGRDARTNIRITGEPIGCDDLADLRFARIETVTEGAKP